MRNEIPYTTAFRKKAVGPKYSNSFGATMNPTPSPASVAPSKRAAALPRRTSLPAVASAMKPRIDGTLAAVEAPSSSRVAPRIGSWVVSPVRITAIAPDRAVQHHPVVADAIRQDAEDRRQHQLRKEEDRREHADDRGVHLRAAEVV